MPSQGSLSSQVALPGLQVKVQSFSHPSPATVLPSSQSSPVSTTLLPQVWPPEPPAPPAPPPPAAPTPVPVLPVLPGPAPLPLPLAELVEKFTDSPPPHPMNEPAERTPTPPA